MQQAVSICKLTKYIQYEKSVATALQSAATDDRIVDKRH